MTFETKKERNGEAPDVWETTLTRRLADELDAFLEDSDDATFLFAEPTTAKPSIRRSGKRPRFKTLATVAAALALLVAVASTTRFYIASPKNENDVSVRAITAEPSLIAWSVESLSEAEWARRVETKLASADVFELYAALSAGNEGDEARPDAEENALAEETSEVDSSEWFSVETLTDVATWEPLKYEPILQVVASLL